MGCETKWVTQQKQYFVAGGGGGRGAVLIISPWKYLNKKDIELFSNYEKLLSLIDLEWLW